MKAIGSKNWVLLILAVGAMLATEAAAQSIKVAIFDPQRVSEETALGKQVQVELTGFRDRKQAEIKEKEAGLEALQKELANQALSLSAEKRTALEKSISRQLLELQSARESASRELQLEVAAAQNGFQEKLSAVVEQFGRDEGFQMILERNLVAWSSPSLDVTTALVDRFDQVFPAKKE